MAGTGKKSFFFSDQEVKKAQESASGKGKKKSGMAPAVKTKIKVKKLGAGTKPKVAAAFTDEHRAPLTKVGK